MAIAQRSAFVNEGHPVEVDLRGVLPPVFADPDRIEQVLGNLLANAAKYGYPNTEIQVLVTCPGTMVQVSVTNRGPGISPDDLPKLFSRFYRTSEAQNGQVSGIGLGLYIARGWVEAHGGTIWAESIPNQETTFHFTLPVHSKLA